MPCLHLCTIVHHLLTKPNHHHCHSNIVSRTRPPSFTIVHLLTLLNKPSHHHQRPQHHRQEDHDTTFLLDGKRGRQHKIWIPKPWAMPHSYSKRENAWVAEGSGRGVRARVVKMGSGPWASLTHYGLEVGWAQFLKKIGIGNFSARST